MTGPRYYFPDEQPDVEDVNEEWADWQWNTPAAPTPEETCQ